MAAALELLTNSKLHVRAQQMAHLLKQENGPEKAIQFIEGLG